MDAQQTRSRNTTENTAQAFMADKYPGIVVLRFKGNFDSAVLKDTLFSQKTEYLLRMGVKHFIIDISEVVSVDSSLMGLISILAKCRREITIICRKDSCSYSLFEWLGLFKVLPSFESLGEVFGLIQLSDQDQPVYREET